MPPVDERLGVRGEPAHRLRAEPGRLRRRARASRCAPAAIPVPGLAVGRLVETPAEIAGMIDAYIAAERRRRARRSSLVTGYDFLEDAANAVRDELAAGTGATVNTLITPNGISPRGSATGRGPPTHLGAKLLGSARHDVIFLAGHFSANSALAADFTTSLLTTDLAGVDDQLHQRDRVQRRLPLRLQHRRRRRDPRRDAAARLGAGVRAEAGDADRRHRLPVRRHRLPRVQRAASTPTSRGSCAPGTGAVAVGEALVKAKLDYLAATPDIRGIHEKALLEATLFGLPMLGVNMPAGRGAGAGPGCGIDRPDTWSPRSRRSRSASGPPICTSRRHSLPGRSS